MTDTFHWGESPVGSASQGPPTGVPSVKKNLRRVGVDHRRRGHSVPSRENHPVSPDAVSGRLKERQQDALDDRGYM